MCDDVYLSAAFFGNEPLYPVSQLTGAVSYRKGRLLISVEDDGSVSFKLLRYPSPVVEVFKVTEKDTVNEQQGIPRPTDHAALSA